MTDLKKNQLNLKKQDAYLLFKEFSFSKAIELLNQIILEDRKDYKCFFLLGTSYLHMKNLDLSEKYLKISVKLNNKYYDASHNLGIVYQLKENFAEAIRLFTKAIELNPKSLGSLTQLGELYEKIRSFDKAKYYYEASLKIDSKNLKANHGMARICIKFGYHKQGLHFLQKSTGLIRFNEKNFEIIV